MALIVVPLILATLVGLIVLWPKGAPPHAQPSGPAVTQVRGTVVTATPPCAAQTPATPGGDCGTATVRVGGKTVDATIPSGTTAPQVHPGDKVVVAADPDAGTYAIIDHDRGTQLIWLLIAFAAAIIAVGRWQGLASLGGLALSFAILLWFILPAIERGQSPLPVAVVGAAAIMFGVLYLTHGVNVPTTIAILGTLAALVLTGLLGLAVTGWMHLTGAGTEDSILLRTALPGIDLRGLLLAGIIIGTLGVLYDVTVAQTLTVAEIAAANPAAPARLLYRRASRIGRAHIGAAVNTIILAYAGASLPLLLLIVVSNPHPWDVLTNQAIATEIVRSVVGTIGLVAAVPVTTALSAWISAFSHRH
ncbi:MAG: YibE/F family protein [Catenulispora sp.]|nr:YibE/F family protein [Catenulispora sp.]